MKKMLLNYLDTRNKKIYRAEGNPSRRAFKEDCRSKF
mgnify:CR=1 FL=1